MKLRANSPSVSFSPRKSSPLAGSPATHLAIASLRFLLPHVPMLICSGPFLNHPIPARNDRVRPIAHAENLTRILIYYGEPYSFRSLDLNPSTAKFPPDLVDQRDALIAHSPLTFGQRDVGKDQDVEDIEGLPLWVHGKPLT